MGVGRFTGFFRRLWPAFLLAGCHVPAAHVASTSTSSNVLPCTVVLARQIVEDSAVEIVHDPWRCVQSVVAEPALGIWALGKGAVEKRVLMPCSAPAPPLAARRTPMDSEAIDRQLDELLGSSVQPATIQYYTRGSEALTALKEMIAQAQRSIDVVMFQWENDTLGAEIASWLAEKAGADLRVRVLVDGGGNLIFGHPTRSHPADVNGVVALLAQKPYVDVIRTRNPLGRVDHRKLVVVDDRIAWTGGRNFTQQSFFDQRDVSLSIEGPLAAALAADFEDFWRDQGGKPEAKKAECQATAAAPNARARIVTTSPMRHEIEQALYFVVDQARDRVYLENYTFCDSTLVYKLAEARKRGVDVRVVMTFCDCTEALNRANRVIANRLLKAGVRVYVYPGLTHTKAAVIDGAWAYLGTGNFDPLSLRRNLELGVALSRCALVSAIEAEVFAKDLRSEWELREPLPLSVKDWACEIMASICL